MTDDLEKIKADIMRSMDEKCPLGLFAVFYDGETRPVAGFVLEQDAHHYARKHAGGVTWEVRHVHLAENVPALVSEAYEKAAQVLTADASPTDYDDALLFWGAARIRALKDALG